MAGIVEGRSLDESINQGQWLARLSIQLLGPQYVFSLSYVLMHKILPHRNDPSTMKHKPAYTTLSTINLTSPLRKPLPPF